MRKVRKIGWIADCETPRLTLRTTALPHAFCDSCRCRNGQANFYVPSFWSDGARGRPACASYGFACAWWADSAPKQTRRVERENRQGVAIGREERRDCRRSFEKAEGAERESLRLVQWHRQKRAGNQKDWRGEISAEISYRSCRACSTSCRIW